MNYSARINCARPRLGDRHDTAQISPPQRCHGYMDANRMKIKRNQCRLREAAKPRGSETCHHTKSQPIWTRIPAGSRRKPIHRNISEIVFSFFWGGVGCSHFYLSGLRPGFGGRGSLKSSRLTPCSTALSPAPRTHGRARSRAHRTWSGEGGGREQEEEEEMGEARIGGRGDSQTK